MRTVAGMTTIPESCLTERSTLLVERNNLNPSAEELDSGTTVVTELRCHGNSETARVQGVRCRVVFSEL